MLFSFFENPILVIARFEFFEHFRNRWVLLYGTSFLLLANLVIYLGGANPLQASGSLLSLVLLLVPIFSLIFGSISFTESLSFMELMIAQPILRRQIYIGKFLGLSFSLSVAFLLGMGIAMLMGVNVHDYGLLAFGMLLILGIFLSFIFVSIAFLIANLSKRKEIVFGLVLVVWFYFFILHDLIMFSLVVSFGDYPLEALILIMSSINPIDLSRVLLALQMDLSSIMGASGKLINQFFGNLWGIAIGAILLSSWAIVPLLLGMRIFNRRSL